MILAGDIGGTKSLFGVYEGEKLVLEHRIANVYYPGFDAVLTELFAATGLDAKRIEHTCFAMAGPLDDSTRRGRMTNLPWPLIDANELEQRFGLRAIRLINDFAAAARGAISSAPEQLHTLQAGTPLTGAPRLVIGAGTGLGMAIALPDGDSWRIIPGEGGHVAFGPADDEQWQLWEFLRKRYGRVTWERAVSGPGLAAIYSFVAGLDDAIDPGEIGTKAIAEPTSPAAHALRLFCSLYGAYAGDMALTILPRGGVFLAGGIATKILPFLATSGFLTAFNAKAHHAPLSVRMPIHVATDPHLALRGAAQF